jgi:hypothetical protein
MLSPALQVEVGVGEHDHADARLRDRLGGGALLRRRLHSQADTVAGGHRMVEACGDQRRQLGQISTRWIEVLVRVQVDTDRAVGGDLQEVLRRRV